MAKLLWRARPRPEQAPSHADEPDDSPPNPTHRALLDLQRSVGNQAVAALIGEVAPLQRDHPKMSRPDPLIDHPYLKRALTPDQYAALATPGGRLSVPLVQLLPPNLTYLSREQIIATVYPQLATEAGPAPNVKELIDQITESETLRVFLTPKLRVPVSITVDIDDTVSFFFEGAQIKSEDGMIAPSALDQVSIATIDMIGHEAHLAAVQLADLRFLDAMATYASEHIAPLAIQIITDPADFAQQEVQQMARETTRLATLAEQIGTGLLPFNQDRAGAVVGDLAAIRSAHAFTTSATSAATAFAQSHEVGNTYGETYEDTEDELAADAHWSPSGVLSGMGWGATKVEHFIGNVVTAGHMDRQAGNARAYQDGRISYNAWKENEGWNIAKSLVVAAATALSGGLASRAAAGIFSVEAGYSAAAESTMTGTFVGGVSSTTGAVAGDVVSKVAAATTGDRYVRDFQNQSLVGPMGWLMAGLGGAMVGGIFGRLFGGRKPTTGDDLSELREQTTRDEGETPPTADVGGNAEPVALLNGKPVKPSHYGTVYHGDDITPQQVVADGGLPARGNDWDLTRHSENLGRFGGGQSALRGGTTAPMTPDRAQGSVHWGDWIYEIKGMPVWDLNQVMQGKVDTGLGFRGPLMHGELESAFPARVPLENILRYGRVIETPGRVRIEWHTFDELTKK